MTNENKTKVEELNTAFIARLQESGPELARARAAATRFTLMRLIEGYVMWGRTAKLYRRFVRGRHRKDKLKFTYTELRQRLEHRAECCSRRDFLLAALMGKPSPAPTNVPTIIS